MDTSRADEYVDEVVKRTKAFCDYVEGTDIMLLHENEKEIYGDTPERCLELYKAMNSPQLSSLFSTRRISCSAVWKTYPARVQYAKKTTSFYMHIKDAVAESGKVVPRASATGILKDIVARLYNRGYEGFLSLEPHLGHFEGFDGLEGEKRPPGLRKKSDAGKF